MSDSSRGRCNGVPEIRHGQVYRKPIETAAAAAAAADNNGHRTLSPLHDIVSPPGKCIIRSNLFWFSSFPHTPPLRSRPSFFFLRRPTHPGLAGPAHYDCANAYGPRITTYLWTRRIKPPWSFLSYVRCIIYIWAHTWRIYVFVYVVCAAAARAQRMDL